MKKRQAPNWVEIYQQIGRPTQHFSAHDITSYSAAPQPTLGSRDEDVPTPD